MSRGKLLRNLSRRVDGRIYRPKKLAFCVLEGRGKLGESDPADDHQIDVAGRVLVRSGDGAIDKGNIDAVTERLQALGENAPEPRRP